MRDSLTLSLALCALVPSVGVVRAQPAPSKPVTLAAIVDSMEAREKLTDSVTIRWTRNDRYSGGALRGEPSTWTSPCEMLLKRDSMRYVGKTFSFSGKDVTQIDHVSSYDGKESRYVQGTEPPRGYILPLDDLEKGNTDAGTPALQPLLLYFRPLAEPYDALSRKTLKILDERKTIDGHDCVAVDDGRTHVYLDPARDLVPVAFNRYTKNHRVIYDCALEYYRKQGTSQWLPKSFQVTMHVRKQQGVPDRIRGDGVQTDLAASLKDSDFLLKFQPGTMFWDMRARQQYRVRDDGSNELIPRRRGKRVPEK